MPDNYESLLQSLLPTIPENRREAFTRNLPFIVQALKAEGILTPKVLSYALATIAHETAGTYEPIEEYGGKEQAKKLGYGGGYYGRGFIQLTHDKNYKAMGDRIGVDLLKNPELALDPENSAKILAVFFKDRGVAQKAEVGDFVGARRPINPDDKGPSIASNANRYLQATQNPIISQLAQPPIKTIADENRATRETTPSAQVSPMIQRIASGASQLQMPQSPKEKEEEKVQRQGGQQQIAQQQIIPTLMGGAVKQGPGVINTNISAGRVPTPTSLMTGNRSTGLRSYAVQRGDTPGGLSQRFLGDFNRWRELYQGDPRKMPVGYQMRF